MASLIPAGRAGAMADFWDDNPKLKAEAEAEAAKYRANGHAANGFANGANRADYATGRAHHEGDAEQPIVCEALEPIPITKHRTAAMGLR